MASSTRAHHTTCPLCEAECGLRIETENGAVLSVKPDPDDPLSRGHMCVKAHGLRGLHEDPDRLRAPVRKTSQGTWEQIGWDEALDEAADRVHRIRREHGRDAMAIYIGNPTVHNHRALVGLTGILPALRTRNRYSATSTDQLPQMLAALQMFGHQLLMPVPDVDRTDFLVILGANPMASNGSIMTAPGFSRRVRAIQKRGGKVVVIDPRRTETATIADAHHFIRPGTDALLLLALLHVLFDEDLVTLGRIKAFASGLTTLRMLVREFSPAVVADAVGMPADTIAQLARDFARAPSAALYARVGACTQRFGTPAAWLAWVVSIVTGNLDRPGGMMFGSPPIDFVKLSAMAGLAGSFDRWRSRVRDLPEFGGEFPVATLADEIETPGDGQIRGLITMAGNPVSSAPNGQRLNAAFEGLDTMICVDPYINETTRHADLILPPISQLQRTHLHFIFGLYSVRQTAKWNPAVLPRRGDERDDAEILLGLARRIMKHEGGALRVGALVAGLLERPELGIDALMRLGPRDVTMKQLQKTPSGVDLGPLESVLPRRLHTSDKRIQLAPPVLVDSLTTLRTAFEGGELGGEQLRLIGRRNLRSNNSWMHNVEPVAGAAPCTLLMHPDDADARELSSGDMVIVSSRAGEVEVEVEVSDEVMPGVVSLPHGHGHDLDGVEQVRARAHGGVSANDVTDETYLDEHTGTAAYNGVPVEVSPRRA